MLGTFKPETSCNVVSSTLTCWRERLTPDHPSLVELVKQCLHNAPHQRPTTDELLARLQRMKEEVEGRYGGGMIKLDLSKMKLSKELEIKTEG